MNEQTQHPTSMTKTYLTVFGTLAFLTIVTVGVTYLHLSRPKAIAVALFIAGIKVSLITAFFMHLKFEKRIIRQIFYTAVILALILLALVLPDFIK